MVSKMSGDDLNTSSGSSSPSANKSSPIREKDSVKKKLKKLKNDPETSSFTKNVCIEALTELKSLKSANEKLTIKLELRLLRENDLEKMAGKLKREIEEKHREKISKGNKISQYASAEGGCLPKHSKHPN